MLLKTMLATLLSKVLWCTRFDFFQRETLDVSKDLILDLDLKTNISSSFS